MTDLKTQAKRARKQIDHLDFDVSALKDHLPKDFNVNDLNFIRKREDEAASKGFVSGFLLGIVVGAVIALIFAPRRGDETRDIVAHTATDLKDKASELVHQARSDNDEAVSSDDVAKVADDAFDTSKDKLESVTP